MNDCSFKYFRKNLPKNNPSNTGIHKTHENKNTLCVIIPWLANNNIWMMPKLKKNIAVIWIMLVLLKRRDWMRNISGMIYIPVSPPKKPFINPKLDWNTKLRWLSVRRTILNKFKTEFNTIKLPSTMIIYLVSKYRRTKKPG